MFVSPKARLCTQPCKCLLVSQETWVIKPEFQVLLQLLKCSAGSSVPPMTGAHLNSLQELGSQGALADTDIDTDLLCITVFSEKEPRFGRKSYVFLLNCQSDMTALHTSMWQGEVRTGKCC